MADKRINRKLAAILAADVVGYSRLMGADEAGTLAALKRHRKIIFDPAVAAHNGRIVKLIGDGVIAEFGSVVDAVNCALSIQRSNTAASDQSASQPVIVLRIGINLGDVIIECLISLMTAPKNESTGGNSLHKALAPSGKASARRAHNDRNCAARKCRVWEYRGNSWSVPGLLHEPSGTSVTGVQLLSSPSSSDNRR